MSEPDSVSVRLQARLNEALSQAGGWLPFDQFMAIVLYEPGLGYYSNAGRKFGWMPQSGSDFVTAPELSPLFGQTLAVQVRQALTASNTDTVYEFGAGSGALAEQLLSALDADGGPPVAYRIVDLSGSLRERQAQRLALFLAQDASRVQWLSQLPEQLEGVVLGNEVLDAMPVQLLVRREEAADEPTNQPGSWNERGVTLGAEGQLVWADRPSEQVIPWEGPVLPGMVTEVHLQAEAFIRTLADRLRRGVALFIDYGFPEAEYYHPQRHQGTLMCHRLHQADDNPLEFLGEKDITAHVNFTGIALAAQDAGLDVLGYTSQARFLVNCGIQRLLDAADLKQQAMAQKLLTEHEMGEIFKVIALGTPGLDWGDAGEAIGFTVGDRTHRL